MTDSDRHVDRWVTVSQAALTVGVSERRIRRWMAAGRLPSRDGDGARLVPVEAVHQMTVTDRQAPDRVTDGATVTDRQPSELAQALALVDRVTRENVELAGRCGWLQSELEQARQTIRQLSPPPPMSPMGETPTEAAAPVSNHPPAPGYSPVRASETAPSRPWWQFWRGWAGEPA